MLVRVEGQQRCYPALLCVNLRSELADQIFCRLAYEPTPPTSGVGPEAFPCSRIDNIHVRNFHGDRPGGRPIARHVVTEIWGSGK